MLSVNDANSTDDSNVTIIPKHKLHGLNEHLHYPPLTYKTCHNHDAIIPTSRQQDLIIGATWTDWLDEPWYDIRVATFERCLWPYEMPECSLWKSINGALLQYAPNMNAVTDITDPSVVYYKSHNRIRIRMKFNGLESIEFIEYVEE